VDQNLGEGDLFLGETRCLLPSHAFSAFVVDLEELVDLLKRETCCLNVEVIDDGNPDEVQYFQPILAIPMGKMLANVTRNHSTVKVSLSLRGDY
jgi:hypothetical protein